MIGTVVYYGGQFESRAAMITAAHTDALVNLCVFPPNGGPHSVVMVEKRVPNKDQREWWDYRTDPATLPQTYAKAV